VSSFKALEKMELDPVWLLRIFTIIPVLLILLAGGGIIWMYFFVLAVLPDGQSQVVLPGLNREVRVWRDSSGVPGIIGENEEDVALVLGYVMAQDRLWQMDYLRRASQGRLAEILGREFLAGDQLIRTVSSSEAKFDRLDQLDERARKWLERFVQGTNAYMVAHAGKLPVEFSLLEYRPEPFSPHDVLRMFQAVAWASSSAPRVDALMTRILARIGTEKGRELLPRDPAAPHALVPSDLQGWKPEGLLFTGSHGRSNALRVPALRGGCAWAVAGEKTRSGRPMLGCMVYQAMSAPGFWYRARLVAGDFHLSGAFVPGVPVAFIGSNERLAWGCVPAPVDDADLFIERLDSNAPKQYWKAGRWHSLREIQETYRVKGDSSVSSEVRLTDAGPLVSKIHKGLGMSLRWTGRDGLRFFPTFYALNRCRTGAEIRTAVKPLVAPSMHVVWADSEGGYGAQMTGAVPLRAPESDGIVPMPGWTGVHDWNGYIPFDELPSETNPRHGLAAVADGRPGGMDYSLFMSCYWNDAARTERIKELLGQEKDLRGEIFQKIQVDDVSPLAKKLAPRIVKALREAQDRGQTGEKALEVLSSWDFRMSRKSPGAAVFALVYQSLVEGLFLEALGQDDYRDFTECPSLTTRAIRRIFLDGHTEWLGSVPPERFLVESFKEGVKKGKSLLGGNPAKWEWGAIHTVSFVHPAATRSRFLEMLYDVGPIGLAGSGDTINLAGWSAAHAFQVIDGVSLRNVSDMTHPPKLLGITPMGASAHFFSPHYKDQTAVWAKGRSLPDPIERTNIKLTGLSAVVFLPSRPEKTAQAAMQVVK
jgi:penicillin amidase